MKLVFASFLLKNDENVYSQKYEKNKKNIWRSEKYLVI